MNALTEGFVRQEFTVVRREQYNTEDGPRSALWLKPQYQEPFKVYVNADTFEKNPLGKKYHLVEAP